MDKIEKKARYFLKIAYHGSGHHGWQKQPGLPTIQGKIEAILAQIGLGSQVVGSGRTDQGVHGLGQIAHVDLPQALDLEKVKSAMNALLKPFIVIEQIWRVKEGGHARFSALKRAYRYQIHQHFSPFLVDRSYYYPHRIDFWRLQCAASHLLGCHDFSAFAKKKSPKKHHRCTIYRAEWEKKGENFAFVIEGNRFLHHMVRNIVGTLLWINKEKKDPSALWKVILKKSSQNAGKKLPPEGLFLTKISYPKELFIAQ